MVSTTAHHLAQLPDDIEALKALVLKERQEKAHLQEQLNVLLAKRFGPSSEKVPVDQLGLFNEAEQALEEADADTDEPLGVSVPAHQRNKPGRRPLPVRVLQERNFLVPRTSPETPASLGTRSSLWHHSSARLCPDGPGNPADILLAGSKRPPAHRSQWACCPCLE